MTLAEFAKRVEGFYTSASNNERILFFVWYLHTYQAVELVPVARVRACFNDLSLAVPDLSKYMQRLALSRPPQLLKKGSSYRLEGSLKTSLDEKYNETHGTVVVSQLLNDLAVAIPDLTERAFLTEALDCYRVKAYRAAIVMTWNLAFDHILTWIVRDPKRLATFNASIKVRFPNKTPSPIAKREDFEEFKEFDIIEIVKHAKLVTKNQSDILHAKLKRRNSVAHPSTIVVGQAQCDDVITDLVNNIVLVIN